MTENRSDVMAEIIEQRRREQGLKITELSARSGVDIGTISRTENARTQLTLDTAIRLCQALRLSLWDLLDPERVLRFQLNVDSGEGITQDDVNRLLEIYGTNRATCEAMFASWFEQLDGILRREETHAGHVEFGVAAQLAVLSDHPLLRVELRYPENSAIELVPEISRLGGTLRKDDFQLLLSAVANNGERFQALDRRGKDVFRRLESNSPDRVKLLDVLAVSSSLKIDLIGIYDRLAGLTVGSYCLPLSMSHAEAGNLISMFVITAYWLRLFTPHGEHWLQCIRERLVREEAVVLGVG